jgi:hypothetical protein
MLDGHATILIKNILAGCVLGGCLLFIPHGAQSATGDSATLQWAANVEPDLAGYRIYHGTTPGIYGIPQTVGKTTTYQYANLESNKTHYFTVTAYDASGNESLPSSEVNKYIADASGGGNGSVNQAPNSIINTPSGAQTILVGQSVTFTGLGTDPEPNLPLTHRWTFGAGSGIPDATVEDPGVVTFNTAGVFTVTYTVTDALGLADPTPATVRITVTATSGPPLTISNLTVASGQSYMVPAAGLQVGGTVYRDRSYTSTTIPPSMQGAAFIQTANNDKAATNAAFLRFEVDRPVTVHVAHDVRIKSKPSWLTTFTDTGMNLVTSDTTLRLFARSFSGGTITLGGNASGGASSMYSVIVQPQVGSGASPDTTTNVVWRNTSSGEVAVWRMNGLTITSVGFPGSASTDWKIEQVGDMNGDGEEDVLWRNTISGVVAIWLMNEGAMTTSGFLGGVSAEWVIKGIGDVNGDGKADVLWRNSNTGMMAVWLMNGLTVTSVNFLGSTPLVWKIEQVGDVNGDGKADLVWQNQTSGTVALWLMNGLTITSVGFPASTSTDWKIQGVGDVNGDGKVDVLWRNTNSGMVAVWLMNGTRMASHGFLGGVPLSWEIKQVSDMDGDGKADVVMQHQTTGKVAVWLMNGLSINSVGFPGSTPVNWKIQR